MAPVPTNIKIAGGAERQDQSWKDRSMTAARRLEGTGVQPVCALHHDINKTQGNRTPLCVCEPAQVLGCPPPIRWPWLLPASPTATMSRHSSHTLNQSTNGCRPSPAPVRPLPLPSSNSHLVESAVTPAAGGLVTNALSSNFTIFTGCRGRLSAGSSRWPFACGGWAPIVARVPVLPCLSRCRLFLVYCSAVFVSEGERAAICFLLPHRKFGAALDFVCVCEPRAFEMRVWFALFACVWAGILLVLAWEVCVIVRS